MFAARVVDSQLFDIPVISETTSRDPGGQAFDILLNAGAHRAVQRLIASHQRAGQQKALTLDTEV